MSSLIRNRDFRCLLCSNGLWWQSLWMEQLVMGWLVLELTDTPWMVAMLGFVRAVPLLFGAFTSPITDHFRRRTLLVALQVVMIAGFSALAMLYSLGRLQFRHIAIVALVNGACWTLDWPTRRSIFPDLVGKERVIDAMVLESISLGLAFFLGPLAGGMLMEYAGAGGALLVLVALCLGSLAFLLALRTSSQSPSRSSGQAAGIQRLRDGLHYIRRKPQVRGVLFITIFMNAWVFPFQTLMPVFARDVLGRGPLGLGVLSGAYGLGMLLGLPLVHRTRQYGNDALLFAGGSLLCAGLVFGFACSGIYGLSTALMFCAGIGQASFSVLQSGIILTEINDDMRGRVMAVLVLAIGAAPVGGLQSIGMVARFGAPTTVAVMAATAALGILGVMGLQRGYVRSPRHPKQANATRGCVGR